MQATALAYLTVSGPVDSAAASSAVPFPVLLSAAGFLGGLGFFTAFSLLNSLRTCRQPLLWSSWVT